MLDVWYEREITTAFRDVCEEETHSKTKFATQNNIGFAVVVNSQNN